MLNSYHKEHYDQIWDALLALEHALREKGWWAVNSPSSEQLMSSEPFCVDTLTFSEWLQWVYIPKMRLLIGNNQALPTVSGLLPIAQEAWRGCNVDVSALLELIKYLDEMINLSQ